MTIAQQAPLSMGFPGGESWTGLPRPSSGDLPRLLGEAHSLKLPTLARQDSNHLCQLRQRKRASWVAQLVKNPTAM